MTCCFVYDACLSAYQLSDNHPFKPIRLELTRTLLEHLELLTPDHVVDFADIATTVDIIPYLETMHTPAYIQAVRQASHFSSEASLKVSSQVFSQDSSGSISPKTPPLPTQDTSRQNLDLQQYGLATNDTPIFPHMHDAIANVCLATCKAVDMVARGEATRTLNLAGGLHHAQAHSASGFCVYNDLALAANYAHHHYGLRVLYIDIDAHHGDGVQNLFYERGDVMTYSIHESGRYLFPGTGHTYELGKDAGRGMSVNMPLEPFTQDDSYLASLEATLLPAIAAFQPDMLLVQVGADMHKRDPLADLALTIQGMAKSYSYLCELADAYCGGKLVATGGGGYDPFHAVPRAWTCLWAALTGQNLPQDTILPERWRNHWAAHSPHPLPTTLFDPPKDTQPLPRCADITKHNAAVARRLCNTLDPVWDSL